MNELVKMLCDHLKPDSIPIIQETIPDNSMFYPKKQYIIISDEKLKDKVETQKCLIHEIRHYYQYTCVSTNNQTEPMLEQWKKELEIYNTRYPCRSTMYLSRNRRLRIYEGHTKTMAQ